MVSLCVGYERTSARTTIFGCFTISWLILILYRAVETNISITDGYDQCCNSLLLVHRLLSLSYLVSSLTRIFITPPSTFAFAYLTFCYSPTILKYVRFLFVRTTVKLFLLKLLVVEIPNKNLANFLINSSLKIPRRYRARTRISPKVVAFFFMDSHHSMVPTWW